MNIKAKLSDYVKESNWIEGITDRESHKDHTRRLADFIQGELTVGTVLKFNKANALRDKDDMNVMIGGKICPRGGKHIAVKLSEIIEKGSELYLFNTASVLKTHQDFEVLHPFMDGNGRTGRAIFLWQYFGMFKEIPESFLKLYYYYTLSMARDDVYKREMMGRLHKKMNL